MTPETRRTLDEVIASDGRTAVAALAAAERAVDEGRLNLAKVLRALALAARARALSLERIAIDGVPATKLFAIARAEYSASTAALLELAATELSGAQLAHDAAQSLEGVLSRTAESLLSQRDVPETVVAQFLWGCAECGHIAEAARPEICPACGSVAGDMEMFAPFFASSTDRIARRQPAQIIEMLRAAPANLGAALGGVSDEDLRRSVAPGEWCMKEIAGHMIDIAELAARRFRAALDPSAPQSERPVLPWKILDGQDYPNVASHDLVARFTPPSPTCSAWRKICPTPPGANAAS